MSEPIPTTPPSFRWQDYVTLDASFGDDRAAMESVLDSLSATAEGRDLIRLSLENAKRSDSSLSHVTMKPGATAPGVSVDATTGTITVDMHEIGNSAYLVADQKLPVTLTASTVNALHQLATAQPYDKSTAKAAQHDVLDQFITAPHLSDGEKSFVLGVVMKNFVNTTDVPATEHSFEKIGALRDAYNAFIQDPANMEQVRKDFANAGMNTDGLTLLPIPPGSNIKLDGDDLKLNLKSEARQQFDNAAKEAASDFTDAYMMKYHNIPPRGTFTNLVEAETPAMPAAAPFNCAPGNLPKYDPPSTPNDTLPRPHLYTDATCTDASTKSRNL